MKRSLIIGVVAALGLVTSAFAQDAVAPEKPIGLAFRLGLFMPQQQDTRAASGDSSFAFGFSYRVHSFTNDYAGGNTSGISISADYAGKNEITSYPFLLNYEAELGSFFYEAGAGVALTHSATEDKSRFAYSLGVGYTFKSNGGLPVFIEAKYLGTAQPDFNGLGVYVGFKL